MLSPRAVLPLCLLFAACSSESASNPGSAAATGVGGGATSTSTSGGGAGGAGGGGLAEDVTIPGLTAAHVFWVGWDEGQNARTVDAPVVFPAAELSYASITLDFTLSCPNDACDPWDRLGSLGLVTGAGTAEEKVVEISRFVTPYGVGATWSADVTDLRPLLTGDATLRVYIDTWVGPGSPYGDGWMVDASFRFTGGKPAKRALANLPIWTLGGIVYGDPARPILEQLPPVDVVVPPGTGSLALRTFVTGHGQGNASNCAEFCKKDHTITANGAPTTATVWRDDCDTTGAPGQQGTWKYPRAGWCPGAITHPWQVELGAQEAGSTLTLSWDVEAYDNTCRPDAPVCSGCTLGTGCDYDGGSHTEPNYQLSGLLIAYE